MFLSDSVEMLKLNQNSNRILCLFFRKMTFSNERRVGVAVSYKMKIKLELRFSLFSVGLKCAGILCRFQKKKELKYKKKN